MKRVNKPMILILYFKLCLCVIGGGPDLELSSEERDRNCKLTVITKEKSKCVNGPKTTIKIYLREKKDEVKNEDFDECFFERIKKFDINNYMLGDNFMDEDSDSEELKDEVSSDEYDFDEMALSGEGTSEFNAELERIKGSICKSLVKSMTRSIRKNFHLDFAIEARFCDNPKYFIILVKDSHVEVTYRKLVDGKVIDDCTWRIFELKHELDILISEDSFKEKAKKVISLIIDRLVAIGLISTQEPKHFSLIVSKNDKEKRTLLRDLFMFPFSMYIKKICEKVFDEKNIPVDSITFVNNKYLRIIESMAKIYHSDFNLMKEEKPEDSPKRNSDLCLYGPTPSFDYRTCKSDSKLYMPDSQLALCESSVDTDTTAPDTKLEVLFNTSRDNFALFLIVLSDGKGEIYNVHLNGHFFHELIKYKIRKIMKIKTLDSYVKIICENVNILSDYTILAIANNTNKIFDKDEKKTDFLYTLLFANRDLYQKAIKQLLLQSQLGKDELFTLLKDELSDDCLMVIKKQIKTTEDILDIDIYVSEKIRELHFKGFNNPEKYKKLQRLVLKSSKFEEKVLSGDLSNDFTTLYEIFSLKNLLEIRKFVISEILSIVLSLMGELKSNYSFISKFSESMQDDSRNIIPWSLKTTYADLRKHLNEEYEHQKELFEGFRPVFYLN